MLIFDADEDVVVEEKKDGGRRRIQRISSRACALKSGSKLELLPKVKLLGSLLTRRGLRPC